MELSTPNDAITKLYPATDEGRAVFQVVEDYFFYDDKGFKLVIEKGFLFDFASVPRLFWTLIPPIEYTTYKAALIHDHMYQYHGIIYASDSAEEQYSTRYLRSISKGAADKAFYNVLISCGCAKPKALLLYYAVKFFAGSHWNKQKNSHRNRTFTER